MAHKKGSGKKSKNNKNNVDPSDTKQRHQKPFSGSFVVRFRSKGLLRAQRVRVEQALRMMVGAIFRPTSMNLIPEADKLYTSFLVDVGSEVDSGQNDDWSAYTADFCKTVLEWKDEEEEVDEEDGEEEDKGAGLDDFSRGFLSVAENVSFQPPTFEAQIQAMNVAKREKTAKFFAEQRAADLAAGSAFVAAQAEGRQKGVVFAGLLKGLRDNTEEARQEARKRARE